MLQVVWLYDSIQNDNIILKSPTMCVQHVILERYRHVVSPEETYTYKHTFITTLTLKFIFKCSLTFKIKYELHYETVENYIFTLRRAQYKD